MRTVLLTGATGFVGGCLYPDLIAAGLHVRCLTRRPEEAARRWPDREWVEGDILDGDQVQQALAGCDAGYYLVHSMAEARGDFRRRERESARIFATAAGEVGLERIIYLGGVAPQTPPSPHLHSRLAVGEILRQGPVPALELRAGMIVGLGSESWRIVRDLAARLPVMVLPRWLRSRSQPVGIGDVTHALRAALDLPLDGSAVYDLPGPEMLSGRQMLEETAALLRLPPPRMLEVPFLTPWLSSLWLRFVTRARWSIARELVGGLTTDLLARDDQFWALTNRSSRLPFREAARAALDEEGGVTPEPGIGGLLERWSQHRRRQDPGPRPHLA